MFNFKEGNLKIDAECPWRPLVSVGIQPYNAHISPLEEGKINVRVIRVKTFETQIIRGDINIERLQPIYIGKAIYSR